MPARTDDGEFSALGTHEDQLNRQRIFLVVEAARSVLFEELGRLELVQHLHGASRCVPKLYTAVGVAANVNKFL